MYMVCDHHKSQGHFAFHACDLRPAQTLAALSWWAPELPRAVLNGRGGADEQPTGWHDAMALLTEAGIACMAL